MSRSAPENPRSINHSTRSFLRFFNNTERKVDVIWLNYEGQNVKFKTLSPGGFVDVNTYVTHPWIFIDSETKDRLVVKSGQVFLPEPWYTRYLGLPRNQLQQTQIQRTHVFITIPLFSLRQRALQIVRNNLVNPEDAYKLEIPKELQNELAKLIKESNETPFGIVYEEGW
ncbi:hypothetical protein R5R35_003630 [Gryllus longicercus]|uniref:von Hippel-Lindau disease tumor suppressor n=1 Tax=Gryllus longicercus TaxID=2509291 RepID=A0AAN9ZBG6_9ORTH